MALRTLLFLITNLAVVAGSFLWGVLGSWVALQGSADSPRRMMGVQVVNDNPISAAQWLVSTVAELTRRADLPMPEVGIYGSPEWNAFPTGPSPEGALVAVSSGILEGMPPQELEAVLAHEMSHVGNGDMVTMTLLQGVINSFVMFLARVASFVRPSTSGDDERQEPPPITALVWPLEVVLGLGGSLITAWFSRHREYRADAGAARLLSSEAMVSALRLLAGTSEVIDPCDGMVLDSLKIAGRPDFMGLLATHPPLEKRIEALQAAALAVAAELDGLLPGQAERARG